MGLRLAADEAGLTGRSELAAAEHLMRYHRIDRDRSFEPRRQAC